MQNYFKVPVHEEYITWLKHLSFSELTLADFSETNSVDLASMGTLNNLCPLTISYL